MTDQIYSNKPQSAQIQPVDDVVDVEFEEVGGSEEVSASPATHDSGSVSNYVAMQDNGLTRFQNITAVNAEGQFRVANNFQKYQDGDQAMPDTMLARYKKMLNPGNNIA